MPLGPPDDSPRVRARPKFLVGGIAIAFIVNLSMVVSGKSHLVISVEGILQWLISNTIAGLVWGYVIWWVWQRRRKHQSAAEPIKQGLDSH